MLGYAKYVRGCFASEKKIRVLIKDLDSRGLRESELKSKLKEALEENVETGDKQEVKEASEQGQAESATDDQGSVLTSGDEESFHHAKDAERESNREEIKMQYIDPLTSAIGASVRVRIVVDKAKDTSIARYETGKITGFRKRTEQVEAEADDDADDEEMEKEEQATKVIEIQEWQATTDRGHVLWLSSPELMLSICRFARWDQKDKTYFEFDAAFHSYRNGIGRHCGRAADAPYSSSPMYFARMMVKKEQELYSKLKNRNYSNNWGGTSGARAIWCNSMK